jgi:hypothetical protein
LSYNRIKKLKFILLNLLGIEINLITHVEKRAFAKFEVVHGFRTLASKNNHAEAVWEGPRHPIS